MARPKGDLTSWWSKFEKDVMFDWDKHSADGWMLNNFFCNIQSPRGRTLIEELEARGYDITTLKFSIKRKTS